MSSGLIFKIQRYSIEDGPGIRTTVFLKGCPLKCIWCSNPESQDHNPEIMYHKLKCLENCRECLSICKYQAINKIRDKVMIDRGKCTKCFECINACPSQALTLIGKRLFVDEVVREVEKDKAFYKSSGGGVTLSGGEPLFQPKFTKEILKICKEKGIQTVLDTSGYAKWQDCKEILKYVDLILYDIKHMDPKKHKELTGVDNKIILENIKKIDGLNIPVVIRFPLIPALNDSKENLYELANLIKSLDNVIEVDILPYHNLGLLKYEALDKKNCLSNFKKPGSKDIYSIKNFLEMDLKGGNDSKKVKVKIV